MREELIAAIRIALERGGKLDSIVQSFFNAGYNPAKVREAASFLTQGASSIMSDSENSYNYQNQEKQLKKVSPPEQPRDYSQEKPINTQQNYARNYQTPVKKKRTSLIITLIIIGLILILAAGALILFWDKIISLFS